MIQLVAADLNHVNAVILERMQSEVALIPELAGHLIAGGGKRMRPMLTLACARLLDYPGARHHKLAAAVEFIHTATLLHDDVVDGSGLRRGKRTANIIWGNPACVLVGDFLFSRSFELMVEDGSLKVLKILSRASAVIAEGEVDQLTAQRRVETSEDHYLEIIAAKTAALFAAACRIAAVVAERERGGRAGARRLWPQSRHRLPAGRRRDRLCLRRRDDGQGRRRRFPRRQGHPAGDPRLCPRRRRRARLLARRDGRPPRRRRGPRPTRSGCSRDSGALDDTIERARHYGQRAIDALGPFPAGRAKAALVEAVEFAIAPRLLMRRLKRPPAAEERARSGRPVPPLSRLCGGAAARPRSAWS